MIEQDKLASILILKLSKRLGIFIENKLLTEEEFNAPSSEKIRFICKSDGFLLAGSDLLKNEMDLKICFNLAWLLNRDFKDYLTKIKLELSEKGTVLNDFQLATRARDLAKRAYWISFSMVIGNEVIYTSNFKKMRELQNFFYPNNRKFNERTYMIVSRNIRIDYETLMSLIESYEKHLLPLYDMLEKYCDKENPQIIAKE